MTFDIRFNDVLPQIDSPNEPTLDRQATFDKAWAHAVGMKERAVFLGMCSYRSPDGNRCLIGAFIPDDMYHESMEGMQVGRLLSKKIIPGPSADPDVRFLGNLQLCHDLTDSMPAVLRALRAFAEQYELTQPAKNAAEA